MREIKFRAWTGERMFEPYYFEGNYHSDSPMPYRCYEDWRDLEDGRGVPCEIMQYTGLKDKNGKEIYEGDIMTSDSKSQSLKVVFESGGFCFANDLASGSDRLHPDRVGRLQIIGNIYEHPELLKQ